MGFSKAQGGVEMRKKKEFLTNDDYLRSKYKGEIKELKAVIKEKREKIKAMLIEAIEGLF